MKKLLSGLALAVVVVLGCEQGRPGGAGVGTETTPRDTTTTTNKPVLGPAENTFTLSVPQLTTHLKQGESKTVSIALSRGKNFDEDVALKFSDIPNGLTIDPPSPMVKHGDKEAKVTVAAAPDAAIGDFTIKVSGHPAKGSPDAVNEFKVSVAGK
jgi:hypothetical protein